VPLLNKSPASYQEPKAHSSLKMVERAHVSLNTEPNVRQPDDASSATEEDEDSLDDFEVIELNQFQQIPFANQLSQFHIFFLFIFLVSLSRVTINILIFKADVKEAQRLTLLTFESCAIFTELASAFMLFVYYRSVTRKVQRSGPGAKAAIPVPQQDEVVRSQPLVL